MLDHRILEHASVLARRLDGELHTVHAFLPLAIAVAATTSVPPMAASVSAEELKVEEAAKRQEVAKLVTQYGIDQANIHVELGGPGELLPRMAGLLHADIMTMGAIARSGLKRAFIGSTAEDVLERLPCDALIVKPLNFADLLPF
jgi:universal stress protein E